MALCYHSFFLILLLSYCHHSAVLQTVHAAPSDVTIHTSKENTSSAAVRDRLRGVIYGALVADAVCLGTHYEYDAAKLRAAYGTAPTKSASRSTTATTEFISYAAPGARTGGQTHGVGWGARNYHPGTVAGDQTDYGEYNILVLEHLSARSSSTVRSGADPAPFSVEDFVPDWSRRIAGNGTWKQWVESQTKLTLRQIQQQQEQGHTSIDTNTLGGNSNAMHLRFAAVFAYTESEHDVVDACRRTMFTHREATALAGNEFFCRTVYHLVHRGDNNRMTPLQAMQRAVASMSIENAFVIRKLQQAVDKAAEATNSDTALFHEEMVDDLALTSMARLWDVGKSEPIKVGKASPTEGTLPGAIYFILKYQDDPLEAFWANSLAGGDNASRSIAIGMVLGAYHGEEGIPSAWVQALNHYDHVHELLPHMPLLRTNDQSSISDEL